MNERAFTPGPWFVSEPNDPGHTGLLIKPIPGDVVAEIDRIPNAIANALLIAAAPELYEALTRIMPFVDDAEDVQKLFPESACSAECRAAVKFCRAVLAKAVRP